MSTSRLSVLMETEGTYPFAGGGVSTWCDILCRELEEVDFHIVAVTGSPAVTLRYELPPNVRSVRKVPLWGAVEPAEYLRAEEPYGDVYRRKQHTTEHVVHERFVPLLQDLLDRLLAPGASAVGGVELVRRMHRYFLDYDYRETWRAEPAWDAFRERMLRPYRDGDHPPEEHPSVFDLTTAMRWFYNFLMPLALPVPRTDVAHATIAGFSGLTAVLARAEHGTPMVVTDHGVFARERYIAISSDDHSFFAKRFLLALSTFVTRLCYAAADQVSPVCAYNQRWEVPLGADPEKIKTIYNGVLPDVFVPHPKPAHRHGRPTVVAAARVFPLKDVETMIRACDVARRTLPDVQFVVYGSLDADVPYVERCRRLVDELGVQEHFELGGFHNRPPEIFNEGDISVLSSISEGFPYTVIESMSCARPVVATDVGGVREALEGCGIVVRPRDHEALGAGVVQLLQDHELRQVLGRLARERVLLRFRTAVTIDAYRETYERLAARRAA